MVLAVQLNQQQRPIRIADILQFISVPAYRAQNVATVVIDFWKRVVKIELLLAFFASNHVGLRVDTGIVA